MKMRAGVGAVLAAVVLAACGPSEPDDPSVVAVIDERPIRVAEVEAYLRASLMEDWADSGASDAELDRVKSRLFDTFLDEQILLAEADRKGIVVTDEELDRYIGGAIYALDTDEEVADDAIDRSQREQARRSLRIERLIDASADKDAEVSEDAIDNFLADNTDPDGEKSALVLRSLRMPDAKIAKNVRTEIRRNRMTFDEAVAKYEETPGQSAAATAEVAHLPDEAREAVIKLKDGWVSNPVEVQGDVYLFKVVAWVTPESTRKDARAWARQEILRLRYENAGIELMDELRGKAELEVFPENLPFTYVE